MAHNVGNHSTTPTRRSVSSSNRAKASTGSTRSTATASSRTTRTSSSGNSGFSLSSLVQGIGNRRAKQSETSANASDSGEKSYRVSKASAATASNGTTKYVIIGVLAVIALLLVINFFMHIGKIHGNVYIGDVNVGGMTKDEAVTEVELRYKELLGSSVTVYISPNAKSQKQADDLYFMITNNETYLENHEEITRRVISMAELEGSVAANALVDEAYKYGRGISSFFTRLALVFSRHEIEPYATFSTAALEAVVNSFNESIGVPMQNSTVWIDSGIVYYEVGQDGYTVNIQEFAQELNDAFFATTAVAKSFVVYSSYTPMGLNEENAQAIAEKLTNAISDGFVCYYGDSNAWSASPITLGSWIKLYTAVNEDGTVSVTYDLDESKIHSWLLKWILADGDSIPVTMETKNNKVTVYPDVSGKIPRLTEAVSDIRLALFGDSTTDISEGAKAVDGNPVYITVDSMSVPSSLSIEDAIAKGVVSPISSFAISYINGSTSDNRTTNVRVAAGLVDGTVVKAGEVFSFNDVVGNTTEDKGFKIGTVIDENGEYADGVGGGVCQVSTTLFNAVYYAGYPIVERTNHSLYSAIYPDGLDAAVDFPSTDFKWENNTSSDIYISFTDDGTSIICTLYGADPHYTVWTYTFDWEFISEHPTRYIIDTSKSANYYEVLNSGVDSRSVRVWRKVLDPTATDLIDEYARTSVYQPITEWVVIGPGEFANQKLAEGVAVYQ